MRALVANGDVNSPRTWSGTPYFFLRAGEQAGLFQGGVSLRPEELRARRIIWNALRPLRGQRPGGYQYSESYLTRVWSRRCEPAGASEYVSHFPLLPPRSRAPVTFYLDATLHQNFEDYGFGRAVGRAIQRDTLAREREALHAARFVVCMSRWCADDVVSFYGLPPERVRVILPGANLDETALPPPLPWAGALSPLRLGFIGKDWERKGGPILLDVATMLMKMGHAVEVIVAGPDVSTLPAHPALRAVGFVDKSKDLPKFLSLVQSFHFGCLLSRVEALGISTLECLALGVPVIGTAVGGIVDAVPVGAGLLVPVQEAAERLAPSLDELVRAPERYAAMRAAAARVAGAQRWTRCVREFQQLLDGK